MLNEKIELIKWVDSFGCAAQWGTMPEPDKPIPVVYCYSVGFVATEDTNTVVLVPHMHDENEAIGAEKAGMGDLAIPKCSILERRVLVGSIEDWDTPA